MQDILKLTQSFGSKENAYFRQVITFWEMSASLVLQGAVNSSLFDAWSAEMHFIWAKFQPFIEEYRAQSGFPNFMKNIETLCEGSAANRERRLRTQEMIKRRMEQTAAKP